MLPRVRFGRTGLEVTRIAMGGYPIAGVNKARGWDPYTPEGRATAIALTRSHGKTLCSGAQKMLK